MTYEYDAMKDEQLTLKAEYEDLLRMYEAEVEKVSELTADLKEVVKNHMEESEHRHRLQIEIRNRIAENVRLLDAIRVAVRKIYNYDYDTSLYEIQEGLDEVLEEQDDG